MDHISLVQEIQQIYFKNNEKHPTQLYIHKNLLDEIYKEWPLLNEYHYKYSDMEPVTTIEIIFGMEINIVDTIGIYVK